VKKVATNAPSSSPSKILSPTFACPCRPLTASFLAFSMNVCCPKNTLYFLMCPRPFSAFIFSGEVKYPVKRGKKHQHSASGRTGFSFHLNLAAQRRSRFFGGEVRML
jgi:hypothetical protein